MNITELKTELEFIDQSIENLQIKVYAQFDVDDVKLLDINNDDLPSILVLFINSIHQLIIDKEDLSMIRLSEADERANCLYEYDLDVPQPLEYLRSVISDDQIEYCVLNDDTFKNIKNLLIVISDIEHEISLYKKISPVEVIGRGRFLLWKDNTRLSHFNQDLLHISDKFQIIQINGTFVILNLKTIERNFGVYDVIQHEARRSIDVIRELNLVSNLESLEELVKDISFARKLTKIARNSPVINKHISNADIIRFSQTHPALQGKMKYTADNSQFMLETKKLKDLFVKLLNDDYLTSELTNSYYDSMAKDNIENIEQE